MRSIIKDANLQEVIEKYKEKLLELNNDNQFAGGGLQPMVVLDHRRWFENSEASSLIKILLCRLSRKYISLLE